MTSQPEGAANRPVITEASYAEPRQSLSVLGITNVILRNRHLVFAITVAIAFFALVSAVLAPRVYVSSALFVPAGKKVSSPASGIAAQFGISVPGSDAQQSPDFYVALLHSKTVQDQVIEASYSFETPSGHYSGTLLDYYGGRTTTLPRRREIALAALDGQIATGTSLKTGAVSLSVTSFSPTLAAAIAKNLLTALDKFNRSRWQTQSATERQFMEEQLSNAAADLRASEDRLESFQEQNREYDRAPRLKIDYERLQREVGMRQQLYSSLAQAYAQARIDAVRDNPSVAIIEFPEVPADPTARGLVAKLVTGLIAGFLLGAFLAFLREYMARVRQQNPEEALEFENLRSAMAREARNPLRLFGIRRG